MKLNTRNRNRYFISFIIFSISIITNLFLVNTNEVYDSLKNRSNTFLVDFSNNNDFSDYEIEMLKNVNIEDLSNNSNSTDILINEFLDSKKLANNSNNEKYETACIKNKELYDLSCSFLKENNSDNNEYIKCTNEFAITCCENESNIEVKSKGYVLLKDKNGKVLIQNTFKRNLIFNIQNLIQTENDSVVNSITIKSKLTSEFIKLKSIFNNFRICLNKINTNIIGDHVIKNMKENHESNNIDKSNEKNDDKKNFNSDKIDKEHDIKLSMQNQNFTITNKMNKLINMNITNSSIITDNKSTINYSSKIDNDKSSLIYEKFIDKNNENFNTSNKKVKNIENSIRFKQRSRDYLINEFEFKICDNLIENNDLSDLEKKCKSHNDVSSCILSLCNNCCNSYNSSKYNNIIKESMLQNCKNNCSNEVKKIKETNIDNSNTEKIQENSLSNFQALTDLKKMSKSLLIRNNNSKLSKNQQKTNNIKSAENINHNEYYKIQSNKFDDNTVFNNQILNTQKVNYQTIYNYIYHMCVKDYMPNCFEKLCSLAFSSNNEIFELENRNENQVSTYENYKNCLKFSSMNNNINKKLEEKLNNIDENYKLLLIQKNKVLPMTQNHISSRNLSDNNVNFVEKSNINSAKSESSPKIFSNMNKNSRINFLKNKISTLKEEVLNKEKELLSLMK